MTIGLLIAEDHELVRAGLRVTFEDTGIEVVAEAATGDEAVRLASMVTADVMLLDIRLPHGDGFHVLRELKSARPELAVLIYSQHERADYKQRARELGACGYLTKRARAKELVEEIRKASRGECQWSAVTGHLSTAR